MFLGECVLQKQSRADSAKEAAGQQHKQRDDQMCFKELGIQTDKPHGIV